MADDMADLLGSLGLEIEPFLKSLGRAEQEMQASIGRMTQMGAGLSLGGGSGQGKITDYTPTAESAQAAAAQVQNLASAQIQQAQAATTATAAQASQVDLLRQEAAAFSDLAASIRAEASLEKMGSQLADQGREELAVLQERTAAHRSEAQEAVAAAQEQQQALAGLVSQELADVQARIAGNAGLGAADRQLLEAKIQNAQAGLSVATAAAQQELAEWQRAKAAEAQATAQAAQQQQQATATLSGATSGLIAQLNGLGLPAQNLQRYFSQGADAIRAMGSSAGPTEGSLLGLSAAQTGLVSLLVLGVQVVLQMTQSFVAYADQIRNTALITGASELEVQALTASLSAQGIASGQVTTALTLMDQRGQQLFDQMQTGQAVAGRMSNALHELGISAVAFATANTDERINLIADALQRANGDTQATAAAVELLGGRFGRNLIPALEGGSAGIEHWRQATVSANAAVEGAQGPVLQWHAAMTQLNLVWQGLTQEVGGVALPVLTAGVTIFRLLLQAIELLLSPLRLVAVAIQGVEAGLGKLKDAWGEIPGPIRSAAEEALKFASPVTALPELAGRAASGLADLAGGHDHAAAAAKEHAAIAEQLSQSLKLARGAYADLSKDQSLTLLEDTVGKLGKTQAGTTLLTKLMSLEMENAGRAATDEATLTEKVGSAALAAGVPLSEVARIMQLLNGVAQANGTTFLLEATAHDQAAQAALRDAAAHRELLSVLISTTSQQGTFTADLAKLGQTAGANFSAAFGQAAGGMAQGLLDQANKADATFNALGAKLLADSATLEDLKKGQAKEGAIAAAQAQVDSDNLALASAQKTVTAQIAGTQSYVDAVRQAQGQITSLGQEAFQTQQQYAQLGVGAEADAARSRLATVQSDISQLTALWQQYYSTTDADARASIHAQIDDLNLKKQADADASGQASSRAKERVATEQQATDAIRGLDQGLFDLQHNYLQETVQGHNAGLDQIGQHEQSLIADLKRLWTEYRNTTDEVQKGILLGQIHTDEALLSDVKQTFGQIASIVQQVRDSELAAGQGVLSAQQSIFDAQERLTYLTADERTRGEDAYLQKVVSVQGQILGLQQQLATETDPDKIFHIKDTIKGLQLEADAANQAANQIRTGVQDAKKPDNSGLTTLRDETAAQVDLNQAIADGYNLQRSGLELMKQVKDTSGVATQAQVDGAHAVTEAARARAQADFAAATASQQSWLAVAETIDTTSGQSTKFSQQYVREAESAAKTSAAAYHLSAQQFKDDLSDEQRAQTALDQQQQASRSGLQKFASDQRSLGDDALRVTHDLTEGYRSFTNSAALGVHALGAAFDASGAQQVDSAYQAAAGAEAAYRAQAQTVLGIEQQLTGELSVEDRKRLEGTLASQRLILDDRQHTRDASIAAAKQAASEFEKSEQTMVQAARKAASDIQQAMNQAATGARDLNKDLAGISVALGGLFSHLGPAAQVATSAAVTAVENGAVDSYNAWQDAVSRRNDLEIKLANTSNASEQQILSGELDAANASVSLAQGAYDEKKQFLDQYTQAVQQAQKDINDGEKQMVDFAFSHAKDTATAKSLGLLTYEADYANVMSQITALEAQEATATTAEELAGIQAKIDGLKQWGDYYDFIIKHIIDLASTMDQNTQSAADNAAKAQKQALDQQSHDIKQNTDSQVGGFRAVSEAAKDAATDEEQAARRAATAMEEQMRAAKQLKDAIDQVKSAAELLDAELNKPTKDELAASSGLADLTAKVADLNDQLANASPLDRHIASLQKAYDEAVANGDSLDQVTKAKQALDAAMHTDSTGGTAAGLQKQIDTYQNSIRVKQADLDAMKAHRDAVDAQVKSESDLFGQVTLTDKAVQSLSGNWQEYANTLHDKAVEAVKAKIAADQQEAAALQRVQDNAQQQIDTINKQKQAQNDANNTTKDANNLAKDAINQQKIDLEDKPKEITNTNDMTAALDKFIKSAAPANNAVLTGTHMANDHSDALRRQGEELTKLTSGPLTDYHKKLDDTKTLQQDYATLLTGPAHDSYVTSSTDVHDLTEQHISLEDHYKYSQSVGTDFASNMDNLITPAVAAATGAIKSLNDQIDALEQKLANAGKHGGGGGGGGGGGDSSIAANNGGFAGGVDISNPYGPYVPPAASTKPPAYAHGGLVPEDQLALVHKGEFVIPADQVGSLAQGGAAAADSLGTAVAALGDYSGAIAQQGATTAAGTTATTAATSALQAHRAALQQNNVAITDTAGSASALTQSLGRQSLAYGATNAAGQQYGQTLDDQQPTLTQTTGAADTYGTAIDNQVTPLQRATSALGDLDKQIASLQAQLASGTLSPQAASETGQVLQLTQQYQKDYQDYKKRLQSGDVGAGSFAEGGIVPEDMLAHVHKGETVIPANLSSAQAPGLPTAYYDLLRAAEVATSRLRTPVAATPIATSGAAGGGDSTTINVGGISVTVQGTANMTPAQFERAVEQGATRAIAAKFGGRAQAHRGVR